MLQTNPLTNHSPAGMPGLLKLVGWTGGAAKERVDARRHFRLKAQFEGVISGPAGAIEVRGVDIHESGAGVRSRHSLQPGAVVFVHLKTHRLMGFAHVRHCTRRGLSGYSIGLEFRSPLMPEETGRWRLQHVQQTDGLPELCASTSTPQ